MHPEIKFCGLTRESDATLAGTLGATYVGAIFAGGPRERAPEKAAHVLAAAGEGVQRVGVFGAPDIRLISKVADIADLHVIQLHGDPTADDVDVVQNETGCQVWAVLRIAGSEFPNDAESVFAMADAVMLDTRVPGQLGGTGVILAWEDLAPALDEIRHGARVVLAGGLTADNVREAIDALEPAIVDVSSGVESAPGVKDHEKMRAFAEAVWK